MFFHRCLRLIHSGEKINRTIALYQNFNEGFLLSFQVNSAYYASETAVRIPISDCQAIRRTLRAIRYRWFYFYRLLPWSLNRRLTETQLVEALQARDERALALLYDRYSAVLYLIVRKIVQEEALAEDVLQEAFLKIWHHSADYQSSKGRLFTWLLNVTRNLAIDKTRSACFRHHALTQILGSWTA